MRATFYEVFVTLIVWLEKKYGLHSEKFGHPCCKRLRNCAQVWMVLLLHRLLVAITITIVILQFNCEL